jgi:uncharacterized protein (TIGR02001 family)
MKNKYSKRSTLFLLINSLLLTISTTSMHAEDDPVTGNVTLATDYVWRGISQTLEDPAIQGGFDWAPDDNWYVGVWGSNVDFAGPEHMELDVYGGWATELSSGLGIDIGFIQYLYFDDTADVDFNEIYAGLSHSGFSGTLSYDTDNKNTYLDAGYEYEFANGLTASAHVGNYDFDLGGGYTDYSIGLAASFAGLDYGLTYYDTDISLAEAGDLDTLALTDGRVVLSIGRSF